MDKQITFTGVHWVFVGLILAGIVTCLSPIHAYAQDSLKNPKQVYAMSDENVQAFFVPLDKFKRSPSEANWPLRSDGCSSEYTVGGKDGLKALPMLPKSDLIVGDLSYYDETYFVVPSTTEEWGGQTFNQYGAYRGTSGDCKTTGAEYTGDPMYSLYSAAGVKALRDAGTTVAPVWTKTAENGYVGVAGYSISPFTYGGWATTTAEAGYVLADLGWKKAEQIQNDINPEPSCKKTPVIQIITGYLMERFG